MTFWQKLDQYPPVLIRLLARSPEGVALTDEQIARGFDPALLAWLSVKKSWDDVPVQHVRGFLAACRADFNDRNWVRLNNRYTRRDSKAKFTHLLKSPEWPRFRVLLAVYAQILTSKL